MYGDHLDLHVLTHSFSIRLASDLHDSCMTAALHRAAAHCAVSGAKLTLTLRRVLELIWQSHRPAGAYDLLAQRGGEGQKVAPPTVYRALDFLVEQGIVHRVESLHAFIGCSEPGHAVQQDIFICTTCGPEIGRAHV